MLGAHHVEHRTDQPLVMREHNDPSHEIVKAVTAVRIYTVGGGREIGTIGSPDPRLQARDKNAETKPVGRAG